MDNYIKNIFGSCFLEAPAQMGNVEMGNDAEIETGGEWPTQSPLSKIHNERKPSICMWLLKKGMFAKHLAEKTAPNLKLWKI